MEIKTCEQYVLAQLFDQQDENDMLNRELRRRGERIDELTGQIDAIEAAHSSLMQEAIREAVRRMGEEPGDPEGKDGLTSYIPGKGCVIWISRKVKAPELYALAAHEAVHAACDMLGGIGEEEPDSEELAYMVQSITAGIIIACEGRSDG